jgi:hypothetical protein
LSVAESPLGRLIGTWEYEPIVDGQSMGRGRATFAWMEGGAFVLERSEAEWSDPGWVANAPMSIRSILGWDDSTDEMVSLYSDSRGVFRIYRMTLTDDTWTLERAAPDFHQRFTGNFRDDGRTIEGRWDSSPDGAAWELDFPITYRRVEGS